MRPISSLYKRHGITRRSHDREEEGSRKEEAAGMESVPDPEPSSTPKLSFYSLPPKPSEPAGMLTPPLRPPASVPFVWEEAPGRPRNLDSRPASARGLDLPPRLLTEMIITSLPSPTTVLDGPYVGRSVSCSSFREVNLHRSFRGSGKIRNVSPEKVRKEKEKGGGFGRKKAGKVKGGPGMVMDGCDGDASLVMSTSIPSSLSDREEHAEVKITRFKRKGSSRHISSVANHFWASLLGSVKQVVPWSTRKPKK